jgi:hypothetical protein
MAVRDSSVCRLLADQAAVLQVKIAGYDLAEIDTQQGAARPPIEHFASPFDQDVDAIQAALHCQHRAQELDLSPSGLQAQPFLR